MRLLNTTTITLHEFHGHRTPLYVILSHTWEQDEVSFQDIQALHHGHLAGLAGYEKIISCCALAASEGWEYIWIDTCCIDKRSSAELTEAINSMFRWYKEAQLCYTYLSDVLTSSPDDFCYSRWFTRGWTLQELLAPGIVTFVNAFWEVLDTKRSLRKELSAVTGISAEHLIDPLSASVATKMSWASQRETTRIEDIAYCLLGLFDVNMPLLYGEGEKAFMRLQHEIIRVSADESIFAWCDSRLIQSGLLAQSPAAFASSGDIAPVIFSEFSRRGIYTVTNRGVTFEHMALLPASEYGDVSFSKTYLEADHFQYADYFAPLNCAWTKDQDTPIILVLRESISVENTLSRIFSWELHTFSINQCQSDFIYRTLYVSPALVASGLSSPVPNQILTFRLRPSVAGEWEINHAYASDLPSDSWLTGWDLKLRSDDLPNVLQFTSNNGENFFLIFRHGMPGPRIDLLIPPPGEGDAVKWEPSAKKVLGLYRDASYAAHSIADSYSQLL
ncbi:MAG: hypothetical protein Q9170_005278 [Blastenia crenularia]